MSIRIVIGLDIGHGESAAHFVELRSSSGALNSQMEIRSLQVKNNKPKIYSTISYSNGTVDIGTVNERSIAYFKRSPEQWDKECPSADGKTYREVMGDFIGKMVECLLNPDINPQLSDYKKSEIALFVGCPADKTWIDPQNQKRYELLIKESTGILNVSVAAESTAAIFSVLSGNKAKLDPSKGVAVFDFGSLTADFTYVLLGKMLMEASWTLGASSIESNIMEGVLANELGEDSVNVYGGDIMLRLLKCRGEIKEAWYGDSVTQGYIDTDPDGLNMSITYRECDQFGNLKTRKKANGSVVPEIKMVNFELNSELMDSVIKEMAVPNVTSKGMPLDPSDRTSWYQYCESFLTRCRDMIQNHQVPCEAVVITGGASRMPFIRELCSDVFGCEVKVYCDESPSYCVCRGLCQIAVNHELTDGKMPEWKKAVQSKAAEVLPQYRVKFSEALTNYLFDCLCNVVAELPDGTTMGELQKALGDAIEANLSSQVKNLIEDPLKDLNDSCSDVISQTAEAAAKIFYGSDASKYRLDAKLIQPFEMSGVNLSGEPIIDTETILNGFMKFIGTIISLIVTVVITSFVAEIPGLNVLVAMVTYAFMHTWLNNNPNYKIKDMHSFAQKLTTKKLKTVVKKKIRDNDELKSAINQWNETLFGKDNDILNAHLDDCVTLAIRSVGLEHFDETVQ